VVLGEVGVPGGELVHEGESGAEVFDAFGEASAIAEEPARLALLVKHGIQRLGGGAAGGGLVKRKRLGVESRQETDDFGIVGADHLREDLDRGVAVVRADFLLVLQHRLHDVANGGRDRPHRGEDRLFRGEAAKLVLKVGGVYLLRLGREESEARQQLVVVESLLETKVEVFGEVLRALRFPGPDDDVLELTGEFELALARGRGKGLPGGEAESRRRGDVRARMPVAGGEQRIELLLRDLAQRRTLSISSWATCAPESERTRASLMAITSACEILSLLLNQELTWLFIFASVVSPASLTSPAL